MTEPTGEQLEVAIETLHAAGATWSGMAGEVDAMATAAAGATLGAFHFSALGHIAGMEETYTVLQERLAALLRQAAQNFDNTAEALKKSADDYQRDEDRGVHRMRGIY